ncbi:Wzt C-terminal domain-containing protein [Desulfacinum infernum DSM 9756]|uniref:Wzt C-terminal domain-containing protein n=1 Tax=Desulfacinum infernum DSM 9756 TaxID=1121391 RepID=A0A1M5GIK5_9BACT|nr:ABC transporter ATP-binding protein [Desulfacinum infernum]SHG03539.1 Wzt C-terminal domain-containing protein [Desulfacinum infernum DSM 9756]
MAMIEVEHLTKEFRLGQVTGFRDTLRNLGARLRGRKPEGRAVFKALDDVSFSIEPGEVVGIIGPNGAGKSTLLKLISGVSKPTSGRIVTRGTIAPLIELGAGMHPELTGRENIYLNGAILGLSKKEIRSKMEEIIDFSELEEFIDTPFKRYSSGMKVKLAFSLATTLKSDILIIDEVLAVGDLAFQRKCFDRMESLIRREGRTVLLVSHNIRQVERLCSRVLLIDQGRILEDGPSRDVCNKFYEMSDKKIMGSFLAGARSRAREVSSGDVELTDVSLVNARGEKIQEVMARDSFCVNIKFTVFRDIPRPIFGVGIHTTDFLYLATKQSAGVFDDRILTPGRYALNFTMKDLPLLPGTYLLRFGIALGDTFQPVYYREAVAGFRIVGGKRMSRATLMSGVDGFLDFDGQWHLVSQNGPTEEPVLLGMSPFRKSVS